MKLLCHALLLGTACASSCSTYDGQCALCVAEKSFFGSCFFCESDSSCHDFGSMLYPSDCKADQCMSSSSLSSCAGSCADANGGETVEGFSVPTAQCLMSAAAAAYYDSSSDPTLATSLNAVGLTHYQEYTNADTQMVAAVQLTANALIIAFRGTDMDDINDFYTDLNVDFKNFADVVNPEYADATSGWKVADGFSAAYMDLRTEVFQAIDWALGLLQKSPTLYITGHSSGGAVSVIATADLYLAGTSKSFDSIHTYTFAGARAGNAAFADGVAALGPEVWTVQNYFDQVPHLPTQDMGFEHVENIVVIGPDDGEIVQVTPSEDAEHFSLDDLNPIDFHHTYAYQDLLNSLQGAATGTLCAASNL